MLDLVQRDVAEAVRGTFLEGAPMVAVSAVTGRGLDDLVRALNSVSATLAGLTWVEGIQLIYRKLEAVLQAQGISEIKAVGESFDPNLHEAVLHLHECIKNGVVLG